MKLHVIVDRGSGDEIVKQGGVFINLARLRRLAEDDNDRTDNERCLRVALQDALTLLYLARLPEEPCPT